MGLTEMSPLRAPGRYDTGTASRGQIVGRMTSSPTQPEILSELAATLRSLFGSVAGKIWPTFAGCSHVSPIFDDSRMDDCAKSGVAEITDAWVLQK